MPDVRGRRRRPRARRRLRAPVRGRHGGQDRHRPDRAPAGDADRAADRRPAAHGRGPEGDEDRRQRAARARPPLRRRAERRAAARRRPRRGLLEPRHRRQPRRLHPLRPLRASVRRHPGQRRDRPLRQGLRDPDRVRPRRPDGRLVVRDVRRVRRRVPDRRARQPADPRRADPAALGAEVGRVGVPVLRRRLRAHLPRRRRAQRDRVRRGARAARVARAAVREGPLRLGLRGLAAAPDRAADPARGLLPEGPAVGRRARRGPRAPQAGRARRLRRGAPALPRGDVGRGARPRGRAADRDPRRARPGRDRRLRLGQVLERGGLPLPEADPRRLRHQQRRPLHAPVPRLERRRAVRGRRLGRGVDHVRRHHQRRRRDPGRHQHDRQPPGRLLVLQAGQAPGDDADRDRPAARADRRARRHLLPDQARHRRRVLQRRDARGDPPRARRPRVHRRAGQQLRRAGRDGAAVPARARRPDLRHRRRHDPPHRAAVGRGGRGRHLLGDGHLPAHDGDRQRALPDRDVLDHRQRRPPGHRPAPAARAEQRAGRLGRRPDPDVLSRLPAGRAGRRPRALRGRRGAASSTPRRA